LAINRFEVVLVVVDVVVFLFFFSPTFGLLCKLERKQLNSALRIFQTDPKKMQQQLKDIADAVVCSCILFRSFFVVPEILFLLLENFGVY
jgi:hypothetical protein